MGLTTQNYREIQDILVETFPTLDSLRQMVARQLGENLDIIAEVDNIKNATYWLVYRWAKSQHKATTLIVNALCEIPDNDELQHFSLYILIAQSESSLKQLLDICYSLKNNNPRILDPIPQSIEKMIDWLDSLDDRELLLRFAKRFAKMPEAKNICNDINKWIECVATQRKFPIDGQIEEPYSCDSLSVLIIPHNKRYKSYDIVVFGAHKNFSNPSTSGEKAIGNQRTENPITGIPGEMFFGESPNQYFCLYKSEPVFISSFDAPSDLKPISDALWEAIRSNQKQHGLYIEFFLPNCLLLHAVDQLYFPLNAPLKFCFEHSILIRSLERCQDQYLYGLCKRRWDTLKTCSNLDWQIEDIPITSGQALKSWVYGNSSDEPSSVWDDLCVDPGHIPTTEISEGQQSSNVNINWQTSDWVCVGLCELPLDHGETTKLLGEIIGSGIPILIWARQACNQDVLKKLLDHSSIFDLPISVHEVRQAGCKSRKNNHIGNHLALLWDNPYQKPPQEQILEYFHNKGSMSMV